MHHNIYIIIIVAFVYGGMTPLSTTYIRYLGYLRSGLEMQYSA